MSGLSCHLVFPFDRTEIVSRAMNSEDVEGFADVDRVRRQMTCDGFQDRRLKPLGHPSALNRRLAWAPSMASVAESSSWRRRASRGALNVSTSQPQPTLTPRRFMRSADLVDRPRRRYARAMRPLRFSINVTLDGCCDHRAGIADEELHRHAMENIAQADAILFGRVTYQMMEAAWRLATRTVTMPDWTEPFARTIDVAKKYVVSSTLDRVDWNAELVRGDLGKAVRELKSESGKGLFVGGMKLGQTLTELGLIDEYEFVVHPRLAGHGPTLFAGLSKWVDLKLVSRVEFSSGAVAMRYEPRR